MRVKFLLLLTSFIFSTSAFAQRGKFFSTDNQLLSSSFVTQVYLDNEGFIWATTRNGINRYDGYQFRVFRKENLHDRSLASNYVNSMMQDSKGTFYFGMYGGLQTWDGNQFHQVVMLDKDGNKGHCFPNCFLERKNGDILTGTSGLGILKFKNQHTAIQEKGPLATIHTVNGMIEDRRGTLWIATDHMGLISYDGKTMKRHLTDKADQVFVCLAEGKDGVIYAGTVNSGAYRMQGDTFVHIEETGNNSVSALYCDHDGMIVIGYDGKGVALFDPRTKELINNPFFSLEVDLTISKVYSITEDKSGNLWLGLLQKGIFMQPINFKGFNYMGHKLGARNILGSSCVVSVCMDSKQRIWVGTDKDGVYCYDYNTKAVKHLKDQFPSVVMALAEGLDGRIWVGSYREGIGWIDPVSFQYHRIPFPQDPHLIVMDVAVSNDGYLWLATMRHGVVKMDAKDGRIVATYKMKNGADKDRKMNCISNDYISQVHLSPDGKRIYASTTMGLCCLDLIENSWTKTFGTNCLNYSMPIRVTREYDGKLWYGTNEGLYCYDLVSHKTKRYTREDGLADNGIATIECDPQGRLWIGTDHGLSCFSPKTNIWQNYFADDGLQSNEFSDGASFISASGILAMGGTAGVSWFDSNRITPSKWEAEVKLTSFAINGQQVNRATRSGNYLVTDTAIIASNRFELSYSDNTFSIQFSTLTYENPEHISYLYSINGEPFNRLQPGENILTLSHLPQGTYRFRVKAERNNIETPLREFTVVIHSPWYRSAWAYFFYAIVIGLFIWQYLAYRRHKEQDRLRLQAHIHAEEMGEAKLRFFMNMSHEIRTPMTLIITPLLSLIKNDDDPNRKGVYETIRRNAERILSLINQMMDLRKIDKGQMQMRMRETNLVSFAKDIYNLFDSQAKSKQIKFLFNFDEEKIPVWIDRQNFDKVFMNVLSNAFKYTPTGGEIGINLTHNSQSATIAIYDNGESIPEDKLNKIFDRFYQTPNSINDRYVGTGIGLDLTRSLVELHHGTITVHNLEKGCEFVINIPMGNSHLSPEEIILAEEEENTDTITPEQLLEEVQESEEPTPIQELKPANSKMTLVIAEDDEEIRNYLDRELSTDYDVHICTNGREALGEIIRCKPDLVMSDIMMPEMDGNALCSRLKTNPSTNSIPVVLLTAKNRDEDKLEGLEAGADAYIVKPFNMDILRRTIINLINKNRMLRLKYERNDDLEEQVDEIRLKSPDEKLLERIMECINKNLNNSDLSVDMIADTVGISRVHLHRKMKDLTGQTPHDFIRNIRLKKAAQLLANQGMNVTEVMYACGFANSASFSTVFKKFYGMSPRDYMKEHEQR
ncbi:two-component regulator propeller domain-containing protein [Prevotella sp. P6B4]|uniref:hybrid sensor histidine kinase/response regulator transcription factor n=1 Tax=Prevotella sp. P6B4 TaxID=1410614 RepID=UPI00048C6559|nr:two-component regulator propeller domain-containing protein [Prevotella sp. P6B4]